MNQPIKIWPLARILSVFNMLNILTMPKTFISINKNFFASFCLNKKKYKTCLLFISGSKYTAPTHKNKLELSLDSEKEIKTKTYSEDLNNGYQFNCTTGIQMALPKNNAHI